MSARGIRNNNFGNIEDGKFAQSLPGYTGTDGRFATFASPEHGVQAMDGLLSSYGKMGYNTIDGIINRWAPAGDGNPVSAYAKSVAEKTGYPLGQPLDMTDPVVRLSVAKAMAEFENGAPMAAYFKGAPPAPQPAAPQPAPQAAPDMGSWYQPQQAMPQMAAPQAAPQGALGNITPQAPQQSQGVLPAQTTAPPDFEDLAGLLKPLQMKRQAPRGAFSFRG